MRSAQQSGKEAVAGTAPTELLSRASTVAASTDAASLARHVQPAYPTPPLYAGEASLPPPPPPATSDFFTFLAQQKNSLLALFDGSKAAASTTATTSASPSADADLSVALSGSAKETSATAALSHRVRTQSDAAVNDAVAVPSPAPAAASPTSSRTPKRGHSSQNSFSYFAIPGAYTEAGTVIERYVARTECLDDLPTSASSTPVQDGNRSAAADDSASTASPTLPTHVHQLQPTQFFVPTLCEVCRRAVLDTKVWLPPSSSFSSSSSSSSNLSFFTRLLTSPTVGLAAVLKNPSMPGKEESQQTPSTTPSPVQQPFLGFGSEGYHCGVCDIALHRQCLRKLRETQPCELLAPAAHRISEAKKTSTDAGSTSSGAYDTTAPSKDGASSRGSSSFTWDSVKTLLGNYLDPNGGSNSRKDVNVKYVLSGVFSLLDTVTSRYPNMTPLTFLKRRKAIQDISEAHQTLYAACTASLRDSQLLHAVTWDAVEKQERLRLAGKQQTGHGNVDNDDDDNNEDAMEQLPSASIITREMHPLKMDSSFLSHLTSGLSNITSSSADNAGSGGRKGSSTNTTAVATSSSSVSSLLPAFAKRKREEGVTGSGATFPVQLLLWRALRYATAVYGEVYRRGSFSSTFSAALLFTVNRGSVDLPKATNDAAVTSLLELPPSSLRLSRWASAATEPSYALLVDHGLGHIVVAFRGTLNTFDIMTDLAAVGVPFCGGYAHQGAAHVVNAIFDHRSSQYVRRPPSTATAASAAPASAAQGVKKQLEMAGNGNVKVVLEPYALQTLATPDGLLDGLEQLAAEYPTYSILITGHSLGGGVAVLFATRLHHDRVFSESLLRRIHVLAFAPMPTLSLPAASCFDAVSCEAADGGLFHVSPVPSADIPQDGKNNRQTPPHHPAHCSSSELATPACEDIPTSSCACATDTAATVRQACFPVWNIVNGFDCVPRLQVNTIDRLVHQIIGPQIAAAAAASAEGQRPSSLSSRAKEALLRQRCRGEGRDSAWVDVNADPTAMEMTDMSSATAQQTGKGKGTFPVASEAASSTASPSPAEAAALPYSFPAPAAAEERVAKASAGAASTSGVSSVAGMSDEPSEAARRAPTAPYRAEGGEETVGTGEPAWASDARAQLGLAGTEEQVMVVKNTTRDAKGNAVPSGACNPAESATGAALAGATEALTTGSASTSSTPYSQCDLSYELHHPGRVLLLTSPWDTPNNRLVDVPRGHPVMHEFFLMKYMLLQHAVNAYSGSLAEIHSQPSRGATHD
jgi:hypothetical protein